MKPELLVAAGQVAERLDRLEPRLAGRALHVEPIDRCGVATDRRAGVVEAHRSGDAPPRRTRRRRARRPAVGRRSVTHIWPWRAAGLDGAGTSAGDRERHTRALDAARDGAGIDGLVPTAVEPIDRRLGQEPVEVVDELVEATRALGRRPRLLPERLGVPPGAAGADPRW